MNAVVLLDRPRVGVARLLINRPDKRNAIDHAVREAMYERIGELGSDDETRALVIGGVGGVLSAGGDLPSMAGLDEAGARSRMEHIHRLCGAIAQAPFPVITAVEGVAAGGAVGMALLGDHIVAEEDARILFPFLTLGLTPDWGQLLTLPRRIGIGPARRVLTSGDTIKGAEAHRLGLADTVTAKGAAMDAALDAAQRFADLPTGAFLRMRERLNAGAEALDAELRREADDQAVCLTGREFAEGFAAFAEKRTPDFTKAALR